MTQSKEASVLSNAMMHVRLGLAAAAGASLAVCLSGPFSNWFAELSWLAHAAALCLALKAARDVDSAISSS